ncbi:unnamed protein product, partial [Protopolystoma xenopodis]
MVVFCCENAISSEKRHSFCVLHPHVAPVKLCLPADMTVAKPDPAGVDATSQAGWTSVRDGRLRPTMPHKPGISSSCGTICPIIHLISTRTGDTT